MNRRKAISAVLALTAAGATLITVAAVRDRPEPPETVAAAPEVVAAPGVRASGKAASELTRGPLMETSPPTRIAIPALRVAEPVIGLGLRPDGSMEVPDDAATVGWYTKAPTPGSLGPAVLAGHVDYNKKPGTFAKLGTLKPADTIVIDRADGSTATFTVTKVERHPKNRFPTDAVYGPIDHAGLRLITCGGDFDNSSGHYRDNIVAYATLR